MFGLMLAAFSCTDDVLDDSAADDSVAESDSGDTGETGDSGEDVICGVDEVTFISTDGTETDFTEVMRAGTYTTFEEPGTLRFCPGTWFTRALIRADIHVEGYGDAPEDTILSAGEQGTILDVTGPEVLMTVSNLTLDRGAGLDVDHNSGGGGIYCEEASVLGEDLVFSNNFANDGPGMYTTSCDFELNRATFVDNLSEDDGGALTLWFSDGVINDVVFENNEALDGGAVAVFNSTLAANNVSLVNNIAHNFGGGMWAIDSEIALTDTVFEDNVNDGTNGGGLLMDGLGALTRVDFLGNDGVTGGGIFVYWDSVLTGEDCDFADNTPNDLWIADYEPEDYGHAQAGGEGYSFACADNECIEN